MRGGPHSRPQPANPISGRFLNLPFSTTAQLGGVPRSLEYAAWRGDAWRATDVAARGIASVHRRCRRRHCHPRCLCRGRCRCRRPRRRGCSRGRFGCCSAPALTRPRPPLSRGCGGGTPEMGWAGDGVSGSSPPLPPPSPAATGAAVVAAPSAAAAAAVTVAVAATPVVGAGAATAAAVSRYSPPFLAQPVAVINKSWWTAASPTSRGGSRWGVCRGGGDGNGRGASRRHQLIAATAAAA